MGYQSHGVTAQRWLEAETVRQREGSLSHACFHRSPLVVFLFICFACVKNEDRDKHTQTDGGLFCFQIIFFPDIWLICILWSNIWFISDSLPYTLLPLVFLNAVSLCGTSDHLSQTQQPAGRCPALAHCYSSHLLILHLPSLPPFF